MLFLILFHLVLLLTPVECFWRHLCKGHLGVARVDPLVAPGHASQHAHIAFGGSNFGMSTTVDDLFASECTSCSITQDKSAYWTPQLYFKHLNNTFQLVPTVGGLTVYYFTERPDTGEKIHAFPRDFRMITGNTFKRAFYGPVPDPEMSIWTDNDTTQQALMEKSIAFNCLNYAPGHNEPSLGVHFLRKKNFLDENCPQGIRAELQFPSCWNGKDIDTTNHASHVAYPSRLREGPCPAGFPIRLPTLFYETIYDTPQFKHLEGEFIFANGDPTGYGYHGDFMAAWDDGVLQAAIDDPNCTTIDTRYHESTGIQEECPIFDFQSDLNAVLCKMEVPSVLREEAVNFIPSLPGNVPINYGPEPATGGSRPNSTVSYSAISQSVHPATTKMVHSSSSLVDIFAITTDVSPTTISSANVTLPPVEKPVSSTIVHGNGTVTRLVVVEEVVTHTVYVERCSPKTAKYMHKHHPRH